jgi:hypothetical protein
MNDLPPQTLKEYIRLSQDGRDPPATKKELLALFKKRRGYTQCELGGALYPGEELDCLHMCRPPGGSMPWDWVGTYQAAHLPEGTAIAFLGVRARMPYTIERWRS